MSTVDQENAPNPAEPIPNPKKRTKTTTVASSRQVTNPSTILSPKSSNSRTLPHSPIRPPFGSPQKSHLARPIFPLKTASPLKVASPIKDTEVAAPPAILVYEKPKLVRGKAAPARKATNPPAAAPKMAVTRSKRAAPLIQEAPADRSVSNSSNTSNTSTGTTVTTVVKKGGRAPPSAAAKKSVAVSAAGRKVAASAKAEAPAAGRRVLRNRP